MPCPAITDCWEMSTNPAICWPLTILPTTLISNDGKPPFCTVNGGAGGVGAKASAHVIAKAGICKIVLQGITTVMPLTCTVPPHMFWGTPGQRALLTVTACIKPVMANCLVLAWGWVKIGGGTAGGGGTATCTGAAGGGVWGGLAVPPLACATPIPPAGLSVRAIAQASTVVASAGRARRPTPIRLA